MSDILIPGENYEKHKMVNLIEWWRNKATNRFETLNGDNLSNNEIITASYDYTNNYPTNKEEAIRKYIDVSREAVKLDIGINAGHDLSLENLAFFAANVNPLDEVSIGHALICDALYYGLENTIQLYRRQLK
jgi:pyridoxine 5'-phosphate synthase PdxJ